MCCDTTKVLDNTNCATGYSGTDTVASGYKCNENFSSKDKQLVSCPQSTNVCGTGQVNTFADKSATGTLKTITIIEKIDLSNRAKGVYHVKVLDGNKVGYNSLVIK